MTFLIDTCDREVIAWEANTRRFTGESVLNAIILALEHRFGEHRMQRPIQRLSDNGSPKFDTFAAILTPGPRVSIVDSMGYAL